MREEEKIDRERVRERNKELGEFERSSERVDKIKDQSIKLGKADEKEKGETAVYYIGPAL